MDFHELARTRQSDRKYADTPVPREVIERILETTRIAPSATNSQPWRFVVVDEPDIKNQVADALTTPLVKNMNQFAREAPVLIVVVEESANATARIGNLLKQRHFAHMDLGIAASYITLAATEEGLGSCIMGWLDERKIRKTLGIPRRRTIALVIALGYSTEEKKSKKRKPMDKIRSYNHY